MPGRKERSVAEKKIRDRRVHMANERTFLAWIRTSLGIMAFGFVVERFSLFMKQLSFLMGKAAPQPSPGYSSILGIFLIGFGTILAIFSFVRFKQVERQINEDSYRPSSGLALLITLSVLAIGIFLVIYLVDSL
jgi:putative membrane protein